LGPFAAGLHAIGKLEADQSKSEYVQARAASGMVLPIELGSFSNSFEDGVVFDEDNGELNSKSGLLLDGDKPWAFGVGNTPKGNDEQDDAEKMPPPAAKMPSSVAKMQGKKAPPTVEIPPAKMPANDESTFVSISSGDSKQGKKKPAVRRRNKLDLDESSIITASSGYTTRSKKKKGV